MILFADAAAQTHRLANVFIRIADPVATGSEATHGRISIGAATCNIKLGTVNIVCRISRTGLC